MSFDHAIALAGHEVSETWCHQALEVYPHATIVNYDFGGDPDGEPTPSNRLGVVEFGRTVFIDASIRGDEAAGLLDAAAAAETF